ncbi:hypothetical protein A2U01_0034065, partial [Trifolium medium]|nr:hypothetical protein [Trifolium medium]
PLWVVVQRGFLDLRTTFFTPVGVATPSVMPRRFALLFGGRYTDGWGLELSVITTKVVCDGEPTRVRSAACSFGGPFVTFGDCTAVVHVDCKTSMLLCCKNHCLSRWVDICSEEHLNTIGFCSRQTVLLEKASSLVACCRE